MVIAVYSQLLVASYNDFTLLNPTSSGMSGTNVRPISRSQALNCDKFTKGTKQGLLDKQAIMYVTV